MNSALVIEEADERGTFTLRAGDKYFTLRVGDKYLDRLCWDEAAARAALWVSSPQFRADLPGFKDSMGHILMEISWRGLIRTFGDEYGQRSTQDRDADQCIAAHPARQ